MKKKHIHEYKPWEISQTMSMGVRVYTRCKCGEQKSKYFSLKKATKLLLAPTK